MPKKGGSRKRPGAHTVHTKHDRYAVDQYGRGSGDLALANAGHPSFSSPHSEPSTPRDQFTSDRVNKLSRAKKANPEASYNVATGWMSIRFDRAPPKEIRDAMKEQGFRYRPRSKTWGAKWNPPREGFAEDLSEKKIEKVSIPRNHAKIAENAQNSADRHREISNDKLDRAHGILGMIPPGQPILRGHHSEGKHRSDLKKVDNLERKGYEEKGIADKFQSKAERHRSLATGGENPVTIYNRIKKLETDEKRFIEQLREYKESGETQWVPDREKWLEHTQARLKIERDKYEASGGIASESMEIKVGDLIKTTSGLAKVLKVNKKSLRVAFENPALSSFSSGGGYKMKIQDVLGPASKEIKEKVTAEFSTPYSTEHKLVSLKAESGDILKVGVPTNLSPESEIPYYEALFKSIPKPENWKRPIPPVSVGTRAEADLLARSITHYVGGAEVDAMSDGTFEVKSEGYYHYIEG